MAVAPPVHVCAPSPSMAACTAAPRAAPWPAPLREGAGRRAGLARGGRGYRRALELAGAIATLVLALSASVSTAAAGGPPPTGTAAVLPRGRVASSGQQLGWQLQTFFS